MDLINKTTKFNGKPEIWNKWSKTFLAKASLRGYKKVLLRQEEEPDPDNLKGKSDLKLKNELAYAKLMVACQEDMCFNIVDGSKTERWPEGDASVAWEGLQQKFERKTTSNLVALKKEFNLCTLRRTDKDPDEWLKNSTYS